MRLLASAGQVNRGEYLFDNSGSTAGGSQLILPRAYSRSSLIIQNNSDTAMFIETGAARATATLSSGTVASCSITNGGFGFTMTPTVEFLGGAFDNSNQITPTSSTRGLPDYPAPKAPNGRPAKAHAVLTNGAVTSIVIDDPGAGYLYPPYVFLRADPSDFWGCADPFYSSATSGIQLVSGGGNYIENGTITTTDPIALYCSAGSKAFTVKWSL